MTRIPAIRHTIKSHREKYNDHASGSFDDRVRPRSLTRKRRKLATKPSLARLEVALFEV